MGSHKKEYYLIGSYQDADIFVASVGSLRRELALVQAAMSADLAAIKSEYEAKAAPLNARITEGVRALEAWCDAHRKELCPNGGKTHRFPSGDVYWRMRPPRVKLKGKVETIIEWLEHHGPLAFLRHKTEINKEAMLDLQSEAEKVPGVSIVRDGEDFSVDPFDAKLSQEVV